MITTLDLFLAIFAALVLAQAVKGAVVFTIQSISMRKFREDAEKFGRGEGIPPGGIRAIPPVIVAPWEGHSDRLNALEKRLAEIESSNKQSTS